MSLKFPKLLETQIIAPLVFLIIGVTAGIESDVVSITITQGQLLGRYRSTDRNVSFVSFEDVPYAQPPIGSLRFKNPLPAAPWEGILDATVPKETTCVQFVPISFWNFPGDDIIGTEDCLILNVYTPKLNPEKPLPVLVIIHGGGFLNGASSSFPYPDLFIEEDIVVVTVNYRLGVLGFLSLDTPEVPGNNGMKDLVLSLEWVRDNIADFGGNNADVTLLGGSAGAGAVSLLQVSPMASGLFHKIIAFGGSSLCGWCLQQASHSYTDQFLDVLDLADTSPGDILQALQDLDLEEIHSAANAVKSVKSNPLEEFIFVPTIELPFDNVEAFITRQPRDYLQSGEYSQVPAIIGYASFEYAIFYNYTIFQEYFNMPGVFAPSAWNLSDNETLLNEVYERVKYFYFGESEFNPNEDRDVLISAMNLGGDIMFVPCIGETAKILAQRSDNAPTYYYRMSYRGQKLGFQITSELGLQGADHVDDLNYLSAVSRDDVTDGESDGWVRNRLAKLFSNFVKQGNPTPGPESQLLPITWSPITEKKANYLSISGELVTSTNPDAGRIQFWRNLRNDVLGY